MVKVQRHLSIHFNTRFFMGLIHEEILSGIEKKVDLDNVVWRYLEPFSIFVPLMYLLRTDPGITSPYFIICVAI
jgi:hypothetical protein